MCKYINPKNYGRLIWAFANKHLLNHIERYYEKDLGRSLRHPPIFFLGAPRSGSTLAVQVITDALDLGYISNRHCQWYGAPALAEQLFHPTANRPQSDYRSAQGITEGSYAPSECGEWWYRFFRRKPSYVTLEEADPKRMLLFRRSVAALTNVFDRPILFKNLYASFRIQAIARYLPESLFVVTHRDEVDNGHSLLETRLKVFKNYDQWWSMEPPEIDSLRKLPAHQQVIEQIRHIHAIIDGDLRLSGVPDSRRFDLSYEQFCESPSKVIDAFQGFLADHGCWVERRGTVPDGFKRRDGVHIDHGLYDVMVKYAQNV